LIYFPAIASSGGFHAVFGDNSDELEYGLIPPCFWLASSVDHLYIHE